MMGAYIKNIKKPKTERQCQFYDEDPFGIRKPYCKIQNVCNGLDDCPLIFVPPHGRLIDADKLMLEMCSDDCREHQYCYPCKRMLFAVRNTETIIESECE